MCVRIGYNNYKIVPILPFTCEFLVRTAALPRIVCIRSHVNKNVVAAFFFLARAGRARPSRSFSTTGRAWPCWLAFYFAAPAGPGGPKLARPLTSAVIGHAHVPRFSCLHKWRRQAMFKVK